LNELNVEIYLHTFEYGRGKPKELEQFCKQIFYYDRVSSIRSAFSKTPFIVKSRSSDKLVKALKKINAPILFEGLHTTYPLLTKSFDDRKTLVRAHNIEHLYYEGLSKSEKRIDKKVFFKTESKKLAAYENILHKVNNILTISPIEHIYFTDKFKSKTIYIPVFHQNTLIKKLSKTGKNALYHGDLRVADNIRSVHFLIDMFKNIKYPLTIASSFKNDSILSRIAKYNHIKFVKIKDQDHIMELFKSAHINVLPTFQKTGIKLKLINTLFNSRFCVVTPKMVDDTGLENLCLIVKTKEKFAEKVNNLINLDFRDEEIIKRTKALESFKIKENAQKIIDLLY